MHLSKWIKFSGILISVSSLFFACYPDSGLESIADYDVVVTVYDKDYDFGAVKTYAMPDTILHLLTDSTASDEDEISREYDELILTTIASNMQQLGYQRITEIDPNDPSREPDVVVLVGVTVTDWNGYSWYPGWWWGWGYWPGWGWWAPGYPGYGPGYPGAVVPYSYSTGTIIIDMMEPDDSDNSAKRIPVVWGAATNGLLGGSQPSGASRITGSIDQAFNQSTYLGVR